MIQKPSQNEIEAAAKTLRIEAGVLLAVIAVEASGNWLQSNGQPIQRFEPHKLPAALQDRIGWQGSWRDSLTLTKSKRRALYEMAAAFSLEEAARATSWGGPQIMGFNCSKAGYATAVQMADVFKAPQAQLDALCQFLTSQRMVSALRARDWLGFATRYNGSGQAPSYAKRLEAAYRKHSGHASPVVLRQGSKGADVKRLQTALKIEVDGAYGPATEKAVRRHQADHALAVDGVVGARTWATIDAKPAKQSALTPQKIAAWGSAASAVGSGAAAVSGALPEINDTAETILISALAACLVISVAVFAWRKFSA